MSRFLLIFILLISGCYRVKDNIDPNVNCTLHERDINALSSPFKELSSEELTKDWGKEYLIAYSFAKELDLYRAVSTFKRAEVLIPKENLNRIQEIQYNIILSYYIGKKYSDVIATFEKSSLSNVDRSFSAFEDLLIILYESYAAVKDEEKAKQTLELLNSAFPKTEKKIELSTALQAGKIEELDKYKSESSSVEMIQSTYSQAKKSTGKAQLFNACLPGAGYLYVGQKKTAATSFLLNALFIAAAYQFFHKGYIAAGAITSSFEVGWYFGGIYGAGQEAKFYNERIYETQTTKVMQQEKLFPAFMLKYGF